MVASNGFNDNRKTVAQKINKLRCRCNYSTKSLSNHYYCALVEKLKGTHQNFEGKWASFHALQTNFKNGFCQHCRIIGMYFYQDIFQALIFSGFLSSCFYRRYRTWSVIALNCWVISSTNSLIFPKTEECWTVKKIYKLYRLILRFKSKKCNYILQQTLLMKYRKIAGKQYFAGMN